MTRKERIAFIIFCLSTMLLNGFFLINGGREGYIVSVVKWSMLYMAVIINLVFLTAAFITLLKYEQLWRRKEFWRVILALMPMIASLLSIMIRKWIGF